MKLKIGRTLYAWNMPGELKKKREREKTRTYLHYKLSLKQKRDERSSWQNSGKNERDDRKRILFWTTNFVIVKSREKHTTNSNNNNGSSSNKNETEQCCCLVSAESDWIRSSIQICCYYLVVFRISRGSDFFFSPWICLYFRSSFIFIVALASQSV